MNNDTTPFTPLQRLINLLKLDRRDIRQIFFYAIFAGLVALSLPLGIQAIINLIQGAQITSSWIVLVVIVTLGVAFQGGLEFMQFRILENIQQKIFTRSSFEFAYRFPKIKLSELRNYYPPELANRFFDTISVQKGLPKILLDFPAAILQIIFGLILLSFYHPFFIIYGFLLILLIYAVFRYTAKSGLDTSLKESKAKYKVAHWIQEIARSIISFKLSPRTNLAMDRNNELTKEYLDARENHFKILVIQFFMIVGFKILVTAGLLVIGGLLVLNQQMNIGQFVAAEIIILLVIGSVEKLIMGLETVYDVLTSLEKIGQIVDKDLEPLNELPIFENGSDFHIEVDQVDFLRSNNSPIFANLSLKINPGDRILLEGPSGSGKTTLLKLITGLLEPAKGNIYINNTSYNGIDPNSLRKYIGQMLPEQMPFEGTIRENISFGNKEVSDSKLYEVVKNVGLLPFLKDQLKGLDTFLHPEGQQIPQTVSRRILLARAILNQPKLLLLKDPFEQFETGEVQCLIEFLTDPKQPWILIVSSRDPLWKNHCNRILEIQNRSIIEK
ncbi:peptidase domain-containing ABC transporter [Aegicerativicinus sediminis]|uniref:peptidase domain-containing ABC transporter n=1 Tax=Aegicerativicinus sediminis TaxID=2893202 RepID=UPI001E549B6A|nr:ATP-binding cassette domain-containing protein [Aegicerativicinus sediminis]